MTRAPAFMRLEQMDLFPPAALLPPRPAVEASLRGPRHQPAGHIYDLQKFFDTINDVVFRNTLAQPVLRWSRNRWRYTLGLCEVKKRVITVNAALDDARVPEVVVAGIVHHEMLHLYFGISEGPNGGQRFHTPEFRAAEKLFPGYADSEKWIEVHWPLRGRPAKKARPREAGFLSLLMLMQPHEPAPEGAV